MPGPHSTSRAVLRAALVAFVLSACQGQGVAEKLNVLMVLIDDLRPESSAYGSSDVSTPSMDALAKESVQFERAYSQQALCGPSRGSLLSGRLPTSLDYYIHTNAAQERSKLRDALVLPAWFASQGYDTFGTSKIFHWVGNNAKYFDTYDKQTVHGDNDCGDAVVCNDSDSLDEFTDYRALEWAGAQLDRFATGARYTRRKTPWFLVVGFRRPHTKFRAPKSFFERFDESEISLPAAIERERPVGVPWQAFKGMCPDLLNSKEVKNSGFSDPYADTLDDAVARMLRMGYFACVEWVDYALGQLLDRLEINGLKDNTLVVVTSDHGWSLGEKTSWCKGTLYERAVRVPMWIRDPIDRSRAGARETAGVSLVDLYPTMAELAGVPLPRQEIVDHGIDGRSFAHLVRDEAAVAQEVAETVLRLPQLGGHPWSFPSSASFSVWPICVDERDPLKQASCRTCRTSDGTIVDCDECGSGSSCSREEAPIAYMGLSVRTERFRYTEWRAWSNDANTADWDAGAAATENRELYDHETEAGRVEMLNVVNQAAYASATAEHANMLRARFVACEAEGTADATSCEARGQHCVFHKNVCINRGFCAFDGAEAAADCASRHEACVWSPLYDQCVNRISDGRTAPVSTEAPTVAPTKASNRDMDDLPGFAAATPAPTAAPAALCTRFKRKRQCQRNGCTFFKGSGCRAPDFCEFNRKKSTRRLAGCSANSAHCAWRSGSCVRRSD